MKVVVRIFMSLFAVSSIALGAGEPATTPPAAEKDLIPRSTLPFVIYRNAMETSTPAFAASGWIGDYDNLEFTDTWKGMPHSPPFCIQIKFTAKTGWAGIIWQNPADNWGTEDGGANFSSAKKITFWAKGERGGEKTSFSFGVLGSDKPYYDCGSGKLANVSLSSRWKQYSIELGGQDLSRIITPFCVAVETSGKPVVIYIDDIIVE